MIFKTRTPTGPSPELADMFRRLSSHIPQRTKAKVEFGIGEQFHFGSGKDWLILAYPVGLFNRDEVPEELLEILGPNQPIIFLWITYEDVELGKSIGEAYGIKHLTDSRLDGIVTVNIKYVLAKNGTGFKIILPPTDKEESWVDSIQPYDIEGLEYIENTLRPYPPEEISI